VLPIPALIIGWAARDIQTGIIAAAGTIAVMFLVSMILMATVKDPTWYLTATPFFLSAAYVIMPDLIIGGFDDVAVMFAGTFGTCVMISRKLGHIPKRAVFPLAIAAIYPIFGQSIPGPIDELLVSIISGATTALGIRKSLSMSNNKAQTSELSGYNPIAIDAEVINDNEE